MEWTEKILVGMKLIAEACASNETWLNCRDCPLNGLCDDMNDARRERMEDFESVADIFNIEIKEYEKTLDKSATI